jgi:hypothetical protein
MSAPLRNRGSDKLENSRRAKHFWCVRATTAILTSKVITVTTISSGSYSYVRRFSSKIPLISVRFPKKLVCVDQFWWKSKTNVHENQPRERRVVLYRHSDAKLAAFDAGLFYAYIRTDGRDVPSLLRNSSRRLPKLLLITITHIISRSAKQTVNLIVCTEQLFTWRTSPSAHPVRLRRLFIILPVTLRVNRVFWI